MRDAVEVYKGINKLPNVMYPTLVFNLRGLKTALSLGAKDLAIGLSASQSFSKRNTHASIEENMKRSEEILTESKKHNLNVRGYISTTIACPYEGPTKPEDVAKLARFLIDKGCYEVSLGDTIGVGTPASVSAMLKSVQKEIPTPSIAVHFHDTYGQALANVYAGLQLGISVVDSSAGGLGGCPYVG